MPTHTNAFVDLNGVPYLLAEYLDRRTFQQIDRTLIDSRIEVDTREAMRAIVDIRIDDIGKRASDGLPAITGNNSKQMQLLDHIRSYANRMNPHLHVLQRGILIRVRYQLENNRTGQVIRSMAEDMRIPDRSYFLDINPRDINDNAIIVNFSSSLVSTINQFTHGIDPMILRVTDVQMFYECCSDNPAHPQLQSMVAPPLDITYGGSMDDLYAYHKTAQSRHMLGDPCGPGDRDETIPPNWVMFNRFYHFEHGGRDLFIHGQEVNDPQMRPKLVPCGTVQVNRAFYINPGHRIIFKFSIWKNDVVIISDTTPIAQALKAPVVDPCYPSMGPDLSHQYWHPHHHPCEGVNPSYGELLDMYQRNSLMDYSQNTVINQINAAVQELTSAVRELRGEASIEGDVVPTVPVLPEKPTVPEIPKDPIAMLTYMVQSLQQQINELKTGTKPGNPDLTPIKPDTKPGADDTVINGSNNEDLPPVPEEKPEVGGDTPAEEDIPAEGSEE